MKHILSKTPTPTSEKKALALIPARYDSQRFPGKLMQKLGDATVILQTYRAAINTGLFRQVVVVTNSPLIYREITDNGGQALLNRQEHACGTDRIAHAVALLPHAELIVNIQGDEPFTRAEPLKALLQAMEGSTKEAAGCPPPGPPAASLMTPITSEEEFLNPNVVKVVTDKAGYALLFSRAPIPHLRHRPCANSGSLLLENLCFRHIGVYAFRRETLLHFATLTPGPLELCEKLENLRFLENGIGIKMVAVSSYPKGIDTPEDLENARHMLHDLPTRQP